MGPFSRFFMSLAEATSKQRAIRRVKPDPVDDELLLELIALALKRPTAQDGSVRMRRVLRETTGPTT